MNPDGYGPGPHEIHSNLINALHHAIAAHPSIQHRASYGQMLAQALKQQVAAHTAHATTGGGYQSGQGTAPADTADSSGGYVEQNVTPEQWALIRAGGSDNMALEDPIANALRNHPAGIAAAVPENPLLALLRARFGGGFGGHMVY